MPNLDDHFRALTKVRPPAEWPELEVLEPRLMGPLGPSPEAQPRRLRTRSLSRERHRGMAAAVAFAVAAAGIGFAVWAFEGTPEPPRPGPAATVENGKIAFVRGAAEQGIINLVDPDGSNPSRLVRGTSPAWSPDGTILAFVDESADGNARHVASMSVGGQDFERLAPLPGQPGGIGPQAWSPDGTQLVFASFDGIHVVNADGTDARRVTRYVGDHACYDLHPSWSPSGDTIVFAVMCEGGNEGLWMVEVDGSDRRPLIAGDYEVDELRSPVWSPDGTKVAFVRTDWALDDPINDASVVVVDNDGTGERRVADGAAFDRSLVWSPDGRAIAFTGYHEGGSDIFLVDLETDEVTQLTQADDAFDPAWQPVPPSPMPSPSPSVEAVVASTMTVGPDGAVRSVVYGEGAVWVAVTGEPAGPGTVLRIDPETDEIVASIPVDAVPGWEVGGAGMMIGAGSVWVTGSVEDPSDPPIGTDAVLVRIDPGSNEPSTIPLGGGTGGDVVVDENGVWVAVGDEEQGELVRVDPATNEIVARIPIPYKAEPYQDLRGVLAVDGVILVSQLTFEGGQSAITAVDAVTNQVLGTSVSSIGSLVARHGEVWTDDGYQLVRIDPRTGQRLGEALQLPEALAAGLLVAEERGLWFLGYDGRTGEGPRTLALFDPRTGGVQTFVDVPGLRAPNAMAVGPHSVWVLDYHGTLTHIELS